MNCCTESLRLRNLYLADGSGTPPVRRDVLLANGKVTAIEPEILGSGSASRTIDCNKRILAPGFLDAHGHSDLSALAKRECFGKISQGVTTEICGNCGLSPFPLTDRNRAHLQELYAQYGIKLDWSGYASFMEEVKRRDPVMRLVPLVGHNTLHAAIAGYEEHKLTASELAAEQELLDRELSQGAKGLSCGLLYVPGKFAENSEIAALMKVVQLHHGIFTVHLRSEGNFLLESMEEIFEAAKQSKLEKVHISHFKTAGRANWHKLDDALELIEKARKYIKSITFDRYSYTESMTQLSVILPGEAGDLPDREITRKLRDLQYETELETALSAAKDAAYFDTVRLGFTSLPEYRPFIGRTIGELARECRKTPYRTVIELLKHNSPECTAIFSGMSKDNMFRIMDDAHCVAGTDESARPLDNSIGMSHPRGFGGIAHFLRLQLDRHGSIERAVEQVTSRTAKIFAIDDCGTLTAGKTADCVLFDPETIDGTSDFLHPHTPATGVKLVIKDGNVVYEN